MGFALAGRRRSKYEVAFATSSWQSLGGIRVKRLDALKGFQTDLGFQVRTLLTPSF
jgi:hypothetical protein